jgi:hypothetical protein
MLVTARNRDVGEEVKSDATRGAGDNNGARGVGR